MYPRTYINVSPTGDKHSGILVFKSTNKKINILATALPLTISKVKVKKHSFCNLKNKTAIFQFQQILLAISKF